MKAQQIWPGLSARDWTAPERRAVGLIRGGRALEEAAAEAKADPERVRAAWAIHAATPEGKAHLAANARVRVLGAEERARVEAELKARDGAPALRAEVEQLRQRLAQAEGLAAIEQQGREAAEVERDEARAEVGRLRAAAAASEAELGAARKARADTDREGRFRVEACKAHERADASDDEVKHLAAQVRGIPELVAAVARIEAALAQGVKTQPLKLAAAVAEESAEEVAQLRAELAARTKERDASRAAMADLLRERQTPTPSAPRSSTCSTKGCGAPSKVKGVCMRCYKREWSARKAASR